MSQTRIKVYGPPGTGKTTHCLEILCNHLMAGEKVLFISFTRAAKDEAHRRVMQTFGEIPANAKVSTIHSLCMRMLEIPKTCLFEQGKVKWQFYQTIDRLGVSNANIKKTLGLYQRLRNEMSYSKETLDRMREEGASDIFSHYGLNSLLVDRYEAWKMKHAYIDFTGIIERVAKGEGTVPDFDVVIIDEAQDLTKLQWRVADRIYEKATTVYVVGDDDQNVYNFLGSNVGTFLSWRCDVVHVLDRTYRLPQVILDYARKVSDRIAYRQEKSIRTEIPIQGAIQQAFLTDAVDFNVYPSELYLVRNQYMLDRVQDILNIKGIPYRGRRSPWMRPDIQAIAGLSDWRAKTLSAFDWKVIKKHLAPGFVSFVETRNPQLVEPNSDFVLPPLNEVLNANAFAEPHWWEKFLPTIPPVLRLMIRNALRRYSLQVCLHPGLELSTIHAAKGKEADRVYVCSALTEKIRASVYITDDEHRLFYVAVTRAKKELFLMTDPMADENCEYPFPTLTKG